MKNNFCKRFESVKNTLKAPNVGKNFFSRIQWQLFAEELSIENFLKNKIFPAALNKKALVFFQKILQTYVAF